MASENQNHIIPDSDEEADVSQDIFNEDTLSYPSQTSSVFVNVPSLQYQNSVHTQPNLDNDSIPQDVLDAAREAESILIPKKSKPVYDKAYDNFQVYLREKKIRVINEIVLLGYFNNLARVRVPQTLWSIHSMLKKTLLTYNSIKIDQFTKVTQFLSANEKNSSHEKKKADTFTSEEVAKFLQEAPDSIYLAKKVALIIGLLGLCRICELYNLKTEDIQDHNTCLIIKLIKTKTGGDRSFAITEDYYEMVKRYMCLRPSKMDQKNFFIRYDNGKCTRQVIGIHKLAEIPKMVANYLNLSNPEQYTGHAFRRTGATLAAEGGMNFLDLKKAGGWKSSPIAEGYVDSSLAQKKKVAGQISNTFSKSTTPSCNIPRQTPLLVQKTPANGNSILERLMWN